jgi:hypothetical protein
MPIQQPPLQTQGSNQDNVEMSPKLHYVAHHTLDYINIRSMYDPMLEEEGFESFHKSMGVIPKDQKASLIGGK